MIVPSIFGEILSTQFGHKNFRPAQEKFLSSAAGGKDILCILPTGEGKSLCYQVVALSRPGPCVVIVPLISLQIDQIQGLEKNGLTAGRIDGNTPRDERRRILSDAASGDRKFLFLSPEMIESLERSGQLADLGIGTIVVDEAHCVLQWGASFRPSYSKLRPWMDLHPEAMRIALTGSATEDSQRHIMGTLLRDGLLTKEPVDRTNIFVEVSDEPLSRIVGSRMGQGSTIVFSSAKDKVDATAEALRNGGFPGALSYHAGMSDAEREQSQMAFMADPNAIMVCTSAFGMGVDVPHVATVVHDHIPPTPEDYHQQIGRAGRDGRAASAFLMRTPGDKDSANYKVRKIENDKERSAARATLEHMMAFLEAPRCRLRSVLSRFGDDTKDEGCGHCDRCLRPVACEDVSQVFELVADAVVDIGDRASPSLLTHYLVGFRSARIQSLELDGDEAYGSAMMTEPAMRHLIRQFIGDGLITFLETTRGLALTKRGRRCRSGLFPAVSYDGRKSAAVVDVAAGVPASIREIFVSLLELRSSEPAISDFADSDLAEVAAGRLPARSTDRQKIVVEEFLATRARDKAAEHEDDVLDLFG